MLKFQNLKLKFFKNGIRRDIIYEITEFRIKLKTTIIKELIDSKHLPIRNIINDINHD